MSVSLGLTKKCPDCGTSIPVDATQCSACGALMPNAPGRTVSAPSGPAPTASPQGAPADAQVRATLNADVLRVLQTDGKIPAIKVVRERTGLGLKQAKDYVEAIEAGRDPGPVAAIPPKTGRGAAVAIAVVLVVIAAVLLWVLLS